MPMKLHELGLFLSVLLLLYVLFGKLDLEYRGSNILLINDYGKPKFDDRKAETTNATG